MCQKYPTTKTATSRNNHIPPQVRVEINRLWLVECGICFKTERTPRKQNYYPTVRDPPPQLTARCWAAPSAHLILHACLPPFLSSPSIALAITPPSIYTSVSLGYSPPLPELFLGPDHSCTHNGPRSHAPQLDAAAHISTEQGRANTTHNTQCDAVRNSGLAAIPVRFRRIAN